MENHTHTVVARRAMKIFNEIPAGCTGVIARSWSRTAAVEYGTVLFRVDPA